VDVFEAVFLSAAVIDESVESCCEVEAAVVVGVRLVAGSVPAKR
jgi:hypothetical protein